MRKKKITERSLYELAKLKKEPDCIFDTQIIIIEKLDMLIRLTELRLKLESLNAIQSYSIARQIKILDTIGLTHEQIATVMDMGNTKLVKSFLKN